MDQEEEGPMEMGAIRAEVTGNSNIPHLVGLEEE